MEGDGQRRPNATAYATMTWLLDGARFARARRPQGGAWLHEFRTPRGRVTVAWAKTGTGAEVTFPGAAEAYDLMGAPVRLQPGGRLTVTDAAVYVVARR